jgi:CDP-glycerol glycerophosphotransferase
MRVRAQRWLTSVVYVVHRALPKREVAVVHGWPDYEDSVLALENGLRNTRIKKTIILLSSDASPRAGELGRRTLVLRKRSVRGFLHFLTARYVLFTHSCYTPRFPPDVVSVNVWHGMPVKRVGWMTAAGNLVPAAQYALATSPLWAGIVQESLRPVAGTLVTGLPRNDRLLLGDAGVGARLGYAPEACVTLVAWLPTFRSSWDAPAGKLRRTHSLGVPVESLYELNSLLERYRAVCVVKPHPLAVREGMPEFSRLRFITDDWLHQQGLTLYELLGTSDALVTDVSSVYVDYLILDRPIVHHFPDVREYESSRGFSLGPIDDYLAGPITRDSDELMAAISAILQGQDTHALTRRRVAGLFHTYLDGGATERLVKHLGLA